MPPLSSRAASRIPFIAARQAAMTTSCRSPGTTISRPSSRTRMPPGTPWANTATSLTRRDRSPSCRISGFSSRTRSATRGQVSSGRCGTAAISWSWCRPSAVCRAAVSGRAAAGGALRTGEGRAAGRPWTTHPTTRAVSAGLDGELLGQALDAIRFHGPAADQQDVGVQGAGQVLVDGGGVQPGRPRLESLDHDDIGGVVDRRPGRDDLLPDDVALALAQLPLQLGGAERFRRPQRGNRRHQRRRAVGGAISPGLGHRLDVAHADADAVERAQQPEAGPGQADVLRGGRDQQAAGHGAYLLAEAAGWVWSAR